MDHAHINVTHFQDPNASFIRLKRLWRDMVDFRIQVVLNQPGSRDRPDGGNEEKTNTDRNTEIWDQVVWALGWRSCHTLEVQQYYILLNREAGLLNTEKQGGRVYGLYLDQGSRFS